MEKLLLELKNDLLIQLSLDEDDVGPTDNFIQSGLVDSIDLMEYINLIESKYKVRIEHKFLSDNTNLTLEKISQYISEKINN